jgi:hypothetical protein
MSAGVLTALTALAAIVKWIAAYFSDSAKLRRLELYLERKKAKVQVERERLLATYGRIEREPPKSEADLLKALQEKSKGRPSDASPPKP